MKIGGLPRLRLYTTVRQYLMVFWSFVNGKWQKGTAIAELEKELALRANVRHAIFTNTARLGIYMVLKHTIKPGQKVIVSPYTIVDVINMVVSAGGVPLFADLDVGTCNVSAAEVERLLRTEANIGAVMVTHFYGLACEVETIKTTCIAHGIPLIEDAAQAFGATVLGQPVGSFGRAGVLSFGLYKNINCFYGGAVLTNDEELEKLVRNELNGLPLISKSYLIKKIISGIIIDIITWPLFFKTITFNIFRYGMLNDVNFINEKLKIDTNPQLKFELPSDYLVRPSSLQARLVLSQLPRMTEMTELRRKNAKRYRDGLKEIKGLMLPPEVEEGRHIYWYFPVLYQNREQLVKFAMSKGRDITASYHRNCADLVCFEEYKKSCEVASWTANSVIYLPTYPTYTPGEIDRTISVIREYFSIAQSAKSS